MHKAQREQLQIATALNRIHHYKRTLARRLKKTKKLFGRRVYAADIHTHSNFSDGKGTVADNYRHLKDAGLDFMFATDHRRIGQKRITRTLANASWGQEPGMGLHHIGLLCNNRVFRSRPESSFNQNLQRARDLARFTWIPHPVGWFSSNWYSDEAIAQLWEAGDSFTIETINGALKILRAYDEFDAKAVTVWDRLLCAGRKVASVGGSDAHCSLDIGTAWTGVFARTRSAASIISALNDGLCFASESALLDLSCNGRPMGSTLRPRKGTKLRLRFRAADSAGLASVRIVSHGRVLKEIRAKGQPVIEGMLERKAERKPDYYRLESVANDDLRAFSTPIYTEPIAAG